MSERRYQEIAGSGRLRVATRQTVKKALEQREERMQTGAIIDSTPWADLDSLGLSYLFQQTLLGTREELVAPEFLAYARQIFKANPIIYACVANRMALFSEATFKYHRFTDEGRPGKLFGDRSLLPLEEPWRGATTSSLLTLAELYVSLGGNFFAARRAGGRIRVMRPDWVAIVLGSDSDDDVEAGDLDAEVIGYMFQPGGPGSGREPVALLPEEVMHFMPEPDPEAPWRGMSWITSVVEDALADRKGTEHKRAFWENGATPNMIVKPAIDDPDDWDKWVTKFRREHEGVANRFKTLFLASGVDADVVGKAFSDTDFAKVQSVGEVRICAASLVPPTVVAVSESLGGSSLNAGNYAAAFEHWARIWARPSWRKFAGAAASVIDVPAGAKLTYDDRDIPALQEDAKKISETQREQSATAAALITAGFDPESVVEFLISDDPAVLRHSGLVSVQLLPPGTENGNGGSSDAFTAQITKQALERSRAAERT